MVPDKFNMVDMGGIDLIMMQGEAVPGLYDKLMAAISNCRYQCLYNWLFDGVLIPPTYAQIEVDDNEVYLNEGVSVTSDDVIHIYSVEPGPVEPEIIPLLAEENGVYTVPAGKDGFNPVTVDVPSYTPVIDPITITENGTYNAPSGVDGYSPVIVNVSAASPIIQPLSVTENGTYNIPAGVDGFGPVTVNVPSSSEFNIDAYAVGFNPGTNANSAVSGGFSFKTLAFFNYLITKIRVFPRETNANVYISDSDGNTIASVLNASVIADQWNDIALQTPVILNPNTIYVVWYSTPSVALKYFNGTPPVSTGLISILSGRYSSSRNTFPTTSENSAYGVDIFIDKLY